MEAKHQTETSWVTSDIINNLIITQCSPVAGTSKFLPQESSARNEHSVIIITDAGQSGYRQWINSMNPEKSLNCSWQTLLITCRNWGSDPSHKPSWSWARGSWSPHHEMKEMFWPDSTPSLSTKSPCIQQANHRDQLGVVGLQSEHENLVGWHQQEIVSPILQYVVFWSHSLRRSLQSWLL